MSIDKDSFIRIWTKHKARQLAGSCFSNDYCSLADIESIAPEDLTFADQEDSFSYLLSGRSYARLTVFYDQESADHLLIPTHEKPVYLNLISKQNSPELEVFRRHLKQQGFFLQTENMEKICRIRQPQQVESLQSYAFEPLNLEDWPDIRLLLAELDPLAANETDDVLLKSIAAGEWLCLRSHRDRRPASIIWRQTPGPREVRLFHLVTRTEERQKGLMGHLLDCVLAMQANSRHLIWVNVTNPARRLYERKGFVSSKKRSQQWLRRWE